MLLFINIIIIPILIIVIITIIVINIISLRDPDLVAATLNPVSVAVC